VVINVRPGGERLTEKTNGHGLRAEVVELARGKNYAALTTLMPDGHPQTQVMWIDTDGDHLLVNTEVHRRKFKNMERDPRVTVAIWDRDDPYSFVEVRGEVVGETKGQEAREHIDRLSQKYHDKPYGTPIQSERVVLRISPLRQVVRLPS
jgi:PPOX class probable F420-dependent enzyme